MNDEADFAAAPSGAEPVAAEPIDATEPGAAAWADALVWLARRLPALADCPKRLGRRGEAELRQTLPETVDPAALGPALGRLFGALGLRARPVRMQLDPQLVPTVAVHRSFGYAVVYAVASDGGAMAEFPDGRQRRVDWPEGTAFVPFEAIGASDAAGSATVFFKELMRRDRIWIPLAALASTLGSLLVLLTSFYSMQVYDRVIGQGGESTLFVLTIGVGIAIAIELALSRIAQREGMSLEALRDANPQLVNPDRLQVGETLKLPPR